MCHAPVVDPKLMPPPVLLLGGAAGSPNPPKVVVPAVVPAPNAAGVDAAGAAVVVGAPPKENGPGDAPKLKDTEHNGNIENALIRIWGNQFSNDTLGTYFFQTNGPETNSYRYSMHLLCLARSVAWYRF